MINTVSMAFCGIPLGLRMALRQDGRPVSARTLQALSAVPGRGQGELVLGPGRVRTELRSAAHAHGASVQSCTGRLPRVAGARWKLIFQNHLPTSDEPQPSPDEVSPPSRVGSHAQQRRAPPPRAPLRPPTAACAHRGGLALTAAADPLLRRPRTPSHPRQRL